MVKDFTSKKTVQNYSPVFGEISVERDYPNKFLKDYISQHDSPS